uniref:Uncharacterized protein n=1 Tax=Laticauda laticaudata TaxID=8630 RepID=A0A8C5RR43_LATLA
LLGTEAFSWDLEAFCGFLILHFHFLKTLEHRTDLSFKRPCSFIFIALIAFTVVPIVEIQSYPDQIFHRKGPLDTVSVKNDT